jgi:protein transport protein YIF1
VRTKLLMLLAPFLRRWTYARTPEHISGGHKYLPPRHDANAPDLYIPTMALWTYCLLVGVALLGADTFRPEVVASTVSSSAGAWVAHALLLKVVLWAAGVPGLPFAELAAYAGYPFVAASATLAAHLTLGRTGYHVAWAYGSLCMAVFLVRTMKRAIYQEARHYAGEASRHNYLLLGLALFQFPFNAWLARLPGA